MFRRPRSHVSRAMATIALSVALAVGILPAAHVAAIAGGYYPVRISPDVPGSFASPVGAALAPSGDIYIADTSNSRIKRMSAAGAVVSVWGARGTGTGQFREPEGLAVLSTGRVVVADTDNNRLQLFEADGTYVATWGSAGAGTGQFSAPCGVAVDASNNVYVADAGNGRIQKFSSAGTYLATIGSQGVGNGQLINPRGVAVDSSGYVYVADTNNKRIQKFTAAGAYVTQWGLVEVSGFTYSRYSTPYSLAIDSTGNLLVADAAGMKYVPSDPSSAKYYVERCSLTGTVLSQWGSPGTAPGQFAGAWGVARRTGGGAYVTDGGNNRVQVLSSTGTADAVWWGKGSGVGELDSPEGLVVDAAGNVYVADTGNDRIEVFDSNGSFVSQWGSTGAGVGALDAPADVALDGSGNVWVVERANKRVQSFTSAGGSPAVFVSGLRGPEGIALDSAGNVYVADTADHQVFKYSPAGALLMTLPGSSGATLWQPTDVALDASGNIYVSDKQAANVQVFTSAGAHVRTIGAPGANPGEFSQPCGVMITGGTLFVVDSGNARIQRFTTGGVYEATFGTAGAALGEMRWPSRGAIDASGRLVVAERDNHRMQIWAYDGTAPTSSFSGFSNFGAYSEPVTMTISATDAASGVATTYYRIDAEAWTPYTAPFAIATEGSHVIRYYSVDRMGNTEAEKQARVTLDWSGPTGTFVLAGGASYVGTSTVSSALSFTDPRSVIDMRFDSGAGYGVWESYATSRAFTLAEGPRTVFVQVRDSLGNTTTQSDSVTVDLTAPSTEATGVPADWTNAPVTVTLTATDTASGVAGTYYRIGSGETLPYGGPFEVADEGGTTVSYWSVDTVGNAEETRTVEVLVDTIPPDGEMQLAGGVDYVATTTVSVEATVPDALEMRLDTGSGFGDWEAYAQTREVTLSGEGTHTVQVEYRDRADNRLTLQDDVFVDLSAPVTLALDVPAGWVTAAPTITLLADDSGSGLESTYYRIGSDAPVEYTVPFEVDVEGVTEIGYWSVDALGWVEAESTATVSLDRAAPSSLATVTPGGWYSGPVTVTIEASDTPSGAAQISGLADIYYRVGAGGPQVYAGPFEVSSEGETTVWYWAVDEAGNIETSSTVITRVDTTAPTGTMVLAGGAAMIATTTPTIDSGVPDAVEMRIDTGGGYGGWMAYAPSVRCTLVGAGEHTVWVEYRDRADNRLELSDSVYLDLAAPVTQASGIPAGWTSQVVTVTLSAEDADSEIAATYYRVSPGGAGFGETTTYADPFMVDAEGETTVEFWSVDELGNTEATRTATVRIDTVPPSGTMTVDGGAEYSTDVTLAIESAVSGAAEMRVDYGAGYSAWVPYDTATESVVPTQGPYTIRVAYRDLALNELELEQDILVDLTTPATTIHGVPDPYSPVTVTLSLEATDTLSGVADTYYRVGTSAPVTYTAPFEIAEEGANLVTYWSVDAAGNVEGEHEAEVVIDAVPVAPDAPLVVAHGRDWVDVEWTAHAEDDVVNHVLWRRPAGDGVWARVADVDVPSVAYHDTGLDVGTAYEYRLTSHDAVGNESAPSPPVAVTAGVEDERLFGDDRYATALAVSGSTFESADVAVLATGESFADALGASSLAGALEAPLLITEPDAISDGLARELDRLGVARVVIVGGERAVGREVADALADSYDVERLGGADRYATAAMVASATVAARVDTLLPGGVIVVRGDTFPDALAASPVAYAGKIPVLLVRPDAVPDATRDGLAGGTYTQAIVLGGSGAIADFVVSALGVPATRVAGADRYATAAEFADWAIGEDLAAARVAGLATGAVFPDALTGGAAIGAERGVLLLTAPTSLAAPASEWFSAHAGALERVTVFGGERAVAADVLAAVRLTLR